jgi:hypothetical protein
LSIVPYLEKKKKLPQGTKENNVKCVFQVSPAVASDPAAGKKQKRDKRPSEFGLKDIKTKDSIQLRR